MPQPHGTALSLAGKGQGGSPALLAEGLEEMGSHPKLVVLAAEAGSTHGCMGCWGAGRAAPSARGTQAEGQAGGTPCPEVPWASPATPSWERGAGGRGEKLVGRSCPFPGLRRLMQKALGKAGVGACGTSRGDSGETRGEAGAGGLRGDLSGGQRPAQREG